MLLRINNVCLVQTQIFTQVAGHHKKDDDMTSLSLSFEYLPAIQDKMKAELRKSSKRSDFHEHTLACEDVQLDTILEVDNDESITNNDSSNEDDWDYFPLKGPLQAFSLEDFTKFRGSELTLHTLVVDQTNDFEIISLNASECQAKFKTPKTTKVLALNGSYFNNDILMRNPNGGLTPGEKAFIICIDMHIKGIPTNKYFLASITCILPSGAWSGRIESVEDLLEEVRRDRKVKNPLTKVLKLGKVKRAILARCQRMGRGLGRVLGTGS